MVREAVAATPEEIQLDKRMKAMVPTAKLALPEEVADAVLWLASPRASYERVLPLTPLQESGRPTTMTLLSDLGKQVCLNTR
jgi:NAD(P)-dependent dehydrogenase (short-subunit alcohol dehydrogenase family)